jgi:hypothetical protein
VPAGLSALRPLKTTQVMLGCDGLAVDELCRVAWSYRGVAHSQGRAAAPRSTAVATTPWPHRCGLPRGNPLAARCRRPSAVRSPATVGCCHEQEGETSAEGCFCVCSVVLDHLNRINRRRRDEKSRDEKSRRKKTGTESADRNGSRRARRGVPRARVSSTTGQRFASVRAQSTVRF